ncbi:hypothetical protein BH23ACT11_BH23ACT11_25030 [soil metagenome]
MRRSLRWLAPSVVLVALDLVWSGIMDFRDAVLVEVCVEPVLFLIGLGGHALTVRH